MAQHSDTKCFTLLLNHTDVWKLLEACKAAGISARIAPTPRLADAKASCGTSLLVECDHADAVLSLSDEHGIPTNGIARVEHAFNPNRDKYC